MNHLFQRLLLIAAHPDDETLGAGGLLSILRAQPDANVRILFICEGSSCRFSSPVDPQSLAAQSHRQSCCLNALSTFNVTDVHFANHPCGNLNLVPILSLNKIIEHHIRGFQPSSVLTHYSYDCNNDHRIVSRAVDMALRPVPHLSAISLMHFEVQSSTDWNFSSHPFQPNFFVPLSPEHLSQKTAAMSMYHGEFSTDIASRGTQALISQAHLRGLQAGSHYAEAFRLVRHNHVLSAF